MKIPIKVDYLREIQSAINYVQGTATTRILAATEVIATVQEWQRQRAQNPFKEPLEGAELAVHSPDYYYNDGGPETVAYLKRGRLGWYLDSVKRE